MTRVGVVVDSIACLTGEMLSQYRISVVPINILFEGRIYRDGIDLTASEAYGLLQKNPDMFASSPASPGEYLAAYRELSRSYEEILCVTLSSKLSTVYNAAMLAKEEAHQELPATTIEVLDSLNATAAEGLIALAAARAAADGKKLAEVVKAAESIRGKTFLVGTFDTVKYAYRTGRLPKIASQFGSLLNVKPLITISDGLVHFASLARTKRHAVDRMLDFMRKAVGDSPVRVLLAHADALDEAEALRERISSQFHCTEMSITYFSPIMAYATGPGALIAAFHTEEGPEEA